MYYKGPVIGIRDFTIGAHDHGVSGARKRVFLQVGKKPRAGAYINIVLRVL